MSAGVLITDMTVRTRRAFSRLALAASVLTLIVIIASAFIRHTQAGLSCIDWPSCYAAIDGLATTSPGVSIARLFHRLAATAAMVIAAGVWLSARTRGRQFSRVRRLALGATLVATALGVLGVATASAAVPAVPLGNMIGGYVMLALLAALVGTTADHPVSAATGSVAPPHRGLLLALLIVVLVQACIGALIGTRFALAGCTELFHCGGSATTHISGGALDPFQPLSTADGRVVPPARGATLHVAHRLLGIAVAVLTVTLAFGLRAIAPRISLWLGVLALGVPMLGAAAVIAMPALALTVLHNAAAAALVATLSFAAGGSRVGGEVA